MPPEAIQVTQTTLPPLEDYHRLLQQVWERNWVTNNGPLARQLEHRLAVSDSKRRTVLLTTNGTIAIQLALRALGVTGSVITTPFSYVATTNALLYENLTPLFVDVEPNWFTLDPALVEAAIRPPNKSGQSIPTNLDVDARDPTRVLYLHDQPILPLGERGTFDAGGIMPCSIARAENGDLYLYYVGWNPSVSVAYRNAVGLAISTDGGATFRRPFPGAVLDRDKYEPFFTASPCGMREGNTWHMWYASSTGFLEARGKVGPLYVLKYAPQFIPRSIYNRLTPILAALSFPKQLRQAWQ